MINQQIQFKDKKFSIEQTMISDEQTDNTIFKVLKAGLCGTDISMICGERACHTTILGHEAVAVVEKNPQKLLGLEVGDRVVFNPNPAPTSDPAILGHDTFGVFQKYVTVANDFVMNQVIKVKDGISESEAVLLEPLACAVHTIRLIKNISKDSKIVILGAGVSAAMHIFVLIAHYGVSLDNIVIINRSQKRTQQLLEIFSQPSADSGLKVRNDDDDSVAADITILCAGNAAYHIPAAIKHTKNNGEVLLFGGFSTTDIPNETAFIQNLIKLRAASERRLLDVADDKQLFFIGARSISNDDFYFAQEILLSKKFDITKIIISSYNLNDFVTAISDPEFYKQNEFGKVICCFD